MTLLPVEKARVLVTGAGGYIGSTLVEHLLGRGYKVTALDRFFFGEQALEPLSGRADLQILKKDIREIDAQDLRGVYAVCDLASLSNDPSGEIDPHLTHDINCEGRARVMAAARDAGVRRYLLSSSCSVYGRGQGTDLTEDGPTSPITTYARSTYEAEQRALEIGDARGLAVTALRNATVFGASRRMRFDLVVNLMTLSAVQKGRIIVMGGGRQWRPLVHVSDVARAFCAIIEADISKVHGQAFNIGLQNYQVLGLAYTVRETLPFPIEIEIAPDDPDRRDYNVAFAKAAKVLGFEAQVSIQDGIREIYEGLKSGVIDTGPKTSTVNWYRNILDAKKLIDDVILNGRIL